MFNALGNSLAGRNAPQDYLLSRYGGASAAYSLQRLTTGVDNVVRARESVGDTESDFNAQEVAGGQLREFALQNDADLIRFADGGGTNDRMYFDGVNDYVEVTGMTASSSYFGACTIQASVQTGSGSVDVLWSLGAGGYNLYIAGGVFYINLTSTSVAVPSSPFDVAVDYDASGVATALRIDGVEQWSGSAAPGTPGTSFYIGRSTGGNYWEGLIYDFSLSGSSVKNFAFTGYGNTNGDWEDTVGSNDGTVNGSPALFSGQGFDAFVTTLYDQSGNSRDATQATAASQPQIVADGVVVTDGTKPALSFDGTDDALTPGAGSTSLSAFLVTAVASSTDGSLVFRGIYSPNASAGSCMLLARCASTDKWGTYGGGAPRPASSTLTTQALVTMSSSNGSSGNFYKDGSSDGTFSSTDGQSPHIGGLAGQLLTGKIAEIVYYESNQSGNRAAIEANIADRYGITLA